MTRRLLLILFVFSMYPTMTRAQVTLTPSNLAFGNQVVATTSTAKTVALKNTQSVGLSISSIVASGDYAQSNNCGVSLAASASW